MRAIAETVETARTAWQVRPRSRPDRPLEAGADRDGGPGDQQLDRAHEGGAKALIPVSAWPRISVCTSLVPS